MPSSRLFDALAAWRYLLLLALVAVAAVIIGSWRGGGAQPKDVGTHYEPGLVARP